MAKSTIREDVSFKKSTPRFKLNSPMIQKRETCKYCGCKMESATAKKQFCSDLHRVYYNRELKRGTITNRSKITLDYIKKLQEIFYKEPIPKVDYESGINEINKIIAQMYIKTVRNEPANGIIGLSIRQHFAAMAMVGILSNSSFLVNHPNADIHKISVMNADALIAELNKS